MNKLKTFFCLKWNKAQETMEIEIALHPKYYPLRKKNLSEYLCAWTQGRYNCSFINAGLSRETVISLIFFF